MAQDVYRSHEAHYSDQGARFAYIVRIRPMALHVIHNEMEIPQEVLVHFALRLCHTSLTKVVECGEPAPLTTCARAHAASVRFGLLDWRDNRVLTRRGLICSRACARHPDARGACGYAVGDYVCNTPSIKISD